VVLSHRNLLSNCAQTRALIELTHRDVLLNVLPVFHSFGLTAGTLLPLLNGTRIFFYPTPLHYHIIPELCYGLGASILFGTNTFLSGYARHAHPYDFYRMRYVIAGAEKLQSETRRIWHEHFGIRILEGYGVTETSPVISVNTPHSNKFGTVGRPVPGMEYRLEPVEGIHRGGRLVVRGPNVMSGYLYHGSEGDIVPPSAGAESGWHDTGDIVDVDGDGYISIIGRAKRFAKIGGEMVSLAAVEELAGAVWPDAKHAALSVPDARKGEHIVLLTDAPQADRHALLAMARQIGVEEREVPRRVEIVDEMPLLGSGKIDYRLAQSIAEKKLESDT
jgi:acyl-[acyl-carrier-protein]-phospholipid O-acyltransferase/long-chain-fatty-acid--[acyl-carrier-protein] ligase